MIDAGQPYVGRRMGAAALLFDQQRRVLLVRQGYGRCVWDLPAGTGNTGKSAQDTAIRELREETGIQATATRMTAVYFDASTDTHDFVFLCTPNEPDFSPSPQLPETTECGFFAFDALPEPMTAFTLRRVRDAKDGTLPSLPILI